MGAERPQQLAGFRKALEREGTPHTNQLAAFHKGDHMLWTILVIVIIVLAVIGLFTVLRRRRA
jgi:hypothetical protein